MLQGNEDTATKITVSWIGVIGPIAAAIISFLGIWANIHLARKNHRELLRHQKELEDRKTEGVAEVESAKAFFNEQLAEKREAFDKEMAQKKTDFDLQLEEKRQEFQKEIESIKASFDDENAAKRARRDYEYEARQRLYKEIEPLLFQLAERGTEVFYRISGLAHKAKIGKLTPTGGQLSDPNEYYALSSMYKLVAPLTVIKLMQRKLTTVDLSLVPRISSTYAVVRFLIWSLTDDFVVRDIENLTYDPSNENSVLRVNNPAVYWRQGIPTGRLDKAIESLIDEKTGQCMSFGDFESEFKKSGSRINGTFEIVFDIFRDFHPRTRPILWRILLIQAHIYFALYLAFMLNREQKHTTDDIFQRVVPLRKVQGLVERSFDWRGAQDQATMPADVLTLPFETAESYLRTRLKELFDEGDVSVQFQMLN